MPDPTRPLVEQVDLARFQQWLTAVRGKGERTADQYTSQARWFCQWLAQSPHASDLDTVTRDVLEDYLMDLAARGCGVEHRRLAIFSLVWLWRYHQRHQPEAVNPASQVTPPPQPRRVTHEWDRSELERLLAVPAADAARAGEDHKRWVAAKFDHTVLAILRYTGVRVSELCSLEPRHLNVQRQRLEVRGKGDKIRQVPVPDPLQAILGDYLERVRPHCPDSPWLLANPRSYRSASTWGTLTPRAAEDIVARYADRAGLPRPATPHRLRHSYATDLLRHQVSLEHIRELLGHSDVYNTVRYLHLTSRDLDAAVHKALGNGDAATGRQQAAS